MLIWKCGPLLSVRRFNLGFPPLPRLNRAVLANLRTWRLRFLLYWSRPCFCECGVYTCVYVHGCVHICLWVRASVTRMEVNVEGFPQSYSTLIFETRSFTELDTCWFALTGVQAEIHPSPPLQCWGYRQMQPHLTFYGSAGNLNSGPRHFVGSFGPTKLIHQPQINYFYFSTPTVQVLSILGNIWDITLGDSVYRRGDTALWWKQPQKWIFQFGII